MSAIRAKSHISDSSSAETPCGGCGKPIGPGPILKLANNAVVHFNDYRCLIQYGKLREISGPSTEPKEPAITETAAIADAEWFAAHPNRKFRARAGNNGIWLIRRRPQGGNGADALLRTFAVIDPPEDADPAIAAAWFHTAYPDWPPEEVRKAAAKALTGGAS